MPRPRKTSTQPKRIKKFVDKPKPVYPEFLQKFIEEVESKTIFKVKVNQYMEGSPYHVGVLVKKGPRYGCVWMVGYATTREELNLFWTSESYKNWSQNQT